MLCQSPEVLRELLTSAELTRPHQVTVESLADRSLSPGRKSGTPPLPEGKYRVLYADTPWGYNDERTGDAVFQAPWTSAGLPTVAIPTGLGQSGLPLSVQLAGLPFQEGNLLAAARWCEETLDVNLWPPDYE